LGDRQQNGTVTNTRLAVRKCRDGEQGREYPYRLRVIDLGIDEEEKPIRTVVVDWTHGTTAAEAPKPDDPWLEGCRRDDQKAVTTRFKRVLLAALAEHGADRPIPVSEVASEVDTSIGDELRTPTSDSPIVHMVDQQLVREAFTRCTPEDPRQT